MLKVCSAAVELAFFLVCDRSLLPSCNFLHFDLVISSAIIVMVSNFRKFPHWCSAFDGSLPCSYLAKVFYRVVPNGVYAVGVRNANFAMKRNISIIFLLDISCANIETQQNRSPCKSIPVILGV